MFNGKEAFERVRAHQASVTGVSEFKSPYITQPEDIHYAHQQSKRPLMLQMKHIMPSTELDQFRNGSALDPYQSVKH